MKEIKLQCKNKHDTFDSLIETLKRPKSNFSYQNYLEQDIIPFNVYNAVLDSADKKHEFKAENTDAAVAAASISNDEITLFSKKIHGILDIKWYYYFYRAQHFCSRNPFR